LAKIWGSLGARSSAAEWMPRAPFMSPLVVPTFTM
jgi:hypothetical protein